jgi:iron complex transport system substrate-binding protein
MPALLDRPSLVDAEFDRIVNELTRRGFLAGAASGAVLLGLAACSNDGPDPAASTGSSWSYTDDRGTAVTVPKQPKRVAFLTDTVGAALWAAGVRPVAACDSHSGIVEAVGLDMSGIVQIATADQKLNLEALNNAQPDLLVDAVQADGKLQAVTANPKAADVAPVVGIDMYRPVEHIIGQADRLTTALGVALADGADKARYDQASAALKAAAAANPDLRVGFVFGIGADQIGVMNPQTWAVLQTAAELGLKLVTVAPGADHQYSQAISWENAPSIKADLLVWAVSDPLPTNPLWQQMPAVKANQYWQPDIPSWYAYSYANFATLLDGLAEHVRTAEAGVGPA